MLRTALLALASATVLEGELEGSKGHKGQKGKELPQGYAPTQGVCSQNVVRGEDFKSASPTCQGLGARGSGVFDAVKLGLTALDHCATFVKQTCKSEDLFVSFHKVEQGFFDGKTSECAYFKKCDCVTQGGCYTRPAWTTQYATGKITEILPGGPKGNGIEPPANANDPVNQEGIAGLAEDPTVNLAEAKAMLGKAGSPEKTPLMSIPDASEIDMRSLRENPSRILEEARAIGQIEPDCPTDYTVAKRRGEWMCMHKRGAFGDISMYVVGAAVVTWCMCFFTFTMVGRRIRSKDDGTGEEEEEEEEEEDW